MKKNFLLILAAMVSTSVLAQTGGGPPGQMLGVRQPLIMDTPSNDLSTIEAPPPAAAVTNSPATDAAEAAPRKAPARQRKTNAAKLPELKTVPLVAGPATVNVRSGSVNVRGQAKLNSEVITRVTNGEQVTVIEEIHLKNTGPEEPSAWAKIVLPEKAHVWVHSSFIDPVAKTVTPRKLNMRGGPGENYSILGTLSRGDTITEINTKGNWIEIEPPTNAYAFMAAQYLAQEPEAPETPTVASTEETPELTNAVPAEPVPAPTSLAEEPQVASNATEMAAVTEPAANAITNEAPSSATNEMMTAAAEVPDVAEEEPPPPRIVEREGIVRETYSIQAPTEYALVSPDNHRPIDYLYSTTTNLDLSRYKGLHVIVTGPEGLDERWKNTPVITIQRIQVFE